MPESSGASSPITQTKRQLQADPGNPRLLFMLGLEEIESRNWAAAASAFEQVVSLAPQVAAAHFNLGMSLFESDELERSIVAYEKALKIQEDWDTLDGYGKALAADGRHEEARKIFQRAADLPELSPQQQSISLRNIAFTFVHAGDWITANDVFQKALGCHESERNLECWFSSLNATNLAAMTLEGIRDFRNQSPHKPLSTRLVVHEAHALRAKGQHREALEKLIENTENPTDDHLLFAEIANLHLHLGHVSEALGCVHKLVSNNQTSSKWMSEWVRVLNLAPSVSPERIFQNAKLWNDQINRSRTSQRIDAPTVDMKVDVKVRHDQVRVAILLNSDCDDALMGQILPWLRGRSRDAFHVTLVWDEWGKSQHEPHMRSLVDQWQSVALWRDKTLTKWCENQEFDLFLDCVGHGAKNRLAITQSHPARRHVLWNFQQQTTGLAEMDYVIHDAIVASHLDKSFVSESVLTPDSLGFCASWVLDDVRNASELTQRTSDIIRFGFVGDLAYISPETLDLWAGVLAATANSLLVIKTPEFCCKSTLDETLNAMSRRGCAAGRIIAEELKIKTKMAHSVDDIDIFLDTAPANCFAGVSSALARGIPVVTLAGTRPLELVTAAIQQRGIGAISPANSFEEYVQHATARSEGLDPNDKRNVRGPFAEGIRILFDEQCYAKSIDDLFIAISQ